MDDAVARLEFRDPVRARQLQERLAAAVAQIGREVAVMHVCGSHEQAIARFGLRATFPPALDLFMGPGCPVCITDAPEVDEAVALALSGVRVLTYGDMLRVPGSSRSLQDARAEGGDVGVVYSVGQAVEEARATDRPIVFFATGFETTAVATAAELLAGPPDNFHVLSAHKYVPPAMEIVASMPDTHVEGYLAAGHAATITGWGLFEEFAERHRVPVVVAGFEPLDILAALLILVEQIRDGKHEVVNAFPRCVSKDGNLPALKALWRVFTPALGRWRGIADVPSGDLRLTPEFARWDARLRHTIDVTPLYDRVAPELAKQCVCGEVLAGKKRPDQCSLFLNRCTEDDPVGACMVSTEGMCRIWARYGGRPNLGV